MQSVARQPSPAKGSSPGKGYSPEKGSKGSHPWGGTGSQREKETFTKLRDLTEKEENPLSEERLQQLRLSSLQNSRLERLLRRQKERDEKKELQEKAREAGRQEGRQEAAKQWQDWYQQGYYAYPAYTGYEEYPGYYDPGYQYYHGPAAGLPGLLCLPWPPTRPGILQCACCKIDFFCGGPRNQQLFWPTRTAACYSHDF